MVQINNGLKLNIPASKLNKMPLNKLETKPETIPSQTEGNNGETQPCRAIKGGSGTFKDPYILDGSDNNADYKYLQKLAKRNGTTICYCKDGRKFWIDKHGGRTMTDKD